MTNMQQHLSPCFIACQALDLDPIGIPWEGDPTVCALDGGDIHPGDLHMPFDPGASFMDDASIVRASNVVSGYTAALLPKAMMLKTQKMVASSLDGAFSIASRPHRAWFLRTPPAAPFVAMISTTTLQHLVWKTAVTLDPDLIRLRIATDEWTIRRPLVVAFADELLASGLGAGALPISVDPSLADTNHGSILRAITPAQRDRWADLNPGEAWAVATLVRAGDDVEAPASFTLQTTPTKD
jgi:CRISPR type IV-associated protein Csf1